MPFLYAKTSERYLEEVGELASEIAAHLIGDEVSRYGLAEQVQEACEYRTRELIHYAWCSQLQMNLFMRAILAFSANASALEDQSGCEDIQPEEAAAFALAEDLKAAVTPLVSKCKGCDCIRGEDACEVCQRDHEAWLSCEALAAPPHPPASPTPSSLAEVCAFSSARRPQPPHPRPPEPERPPTLCTSPKTQP